MPTSSNGRGVYFWLIATFGLLMGSASLTHDQRIHHGWRLESKVKVSDDVISIATSQIHKEVVYTLASNQIINMIEVKTGEVWQEINTSRNASWDSIHTARCVGQVADECVYMGASDLNNWIVYYFSESDWVKPKMRVISFPKNKDDVKLVDVFDSMMRPNVLIQRNDASIYQVLLERPSNPLELKSQIEFSGVRVGHRGIIFTRRSKLWIADDKAMWRRAPEEILERNSADLVFLDSDWTMGHGFYLLQRGKHCHILHYNQSEGRYRHMIMDSSGDTRPNTSCADQAASSCRAWKNAGICSKNTYVRETYCKFSCGTCDREGSLTGRIYTQTATTTVSAAQQVNTGGSQSCYDESSNCKGWSLAGYCERRPDYMRSTCRKSCHFCRTTAVTSTCSDSDSLCPNWAAVGRCDAPESEAFMRQSCKSSCKICMNENQQHQLEVCSDKEGQSCSLWAQRGYCESSRVYMERNCAASCNLCPKSDSRIDHSRTSQCKDNSEHCQRWSEGNKCQTRSDFMNINCPASCGLCVQQAELKENKDDSCLDSSQYCMVWKTNNMCGVKSTYMKAACSASCGFCSRKDVITGSSHETRTGTLLSGSCTDKRSFCTTWTQYGLCERNRNFMKINCPRSCDLCTNSGDEKQSDEPAQNIQECKDSSENCNIWSKNGYCTKHEKYMNSNCKASCNKCAIIKEQIKSNGCTDNHDQCSHWALEGRCYSRPDFMMLNCKASCSPACKYNTENNSIRKTENTTTVQNIQEYTQSAQESAVAACRDNHEFCSLWKGAGYCRSKADYMEYYCPLSCNFCSSTEITTVKPQKQVLTTVYKHPTSPVASTQRQQNTNDKKCAREEDTATCSAWVKSGYCGRYERYMSEYCSKSCGFCGSYRDPVIPLSTTLRVTQRPVTARLVTRRPVTRRPVTRRPVTRRPVTRRPVTRRPVTRRPVTRRPVTRRPVTRRPATQRPVTRLTVRPDEHCMDRHTFCNTWVKQGKCAIRPQFMSSVCKQSCGLC